jgi:glycosidase
MDELRIAGERVEAEIAYRRVHRPAPDYSGPLLELTDEQAERLHGLLAQIYDDSRVPACFEELLRLMRVYYAYKTTEMCEDDREFVPAQRFSERDVVLITYGDLLVSPGQTPLKTLCELLERRARWISTVHILPFFPYSSDRGFSVVDYEQVDPRLGGWEDVEYLSTQFQVMFDGVVNHISAKSRWFQEFLNGNPAFRDFFISFDSRDAISEEHRRLILRPRTSDLLSPYATIEGTRYVWTTFSHDQIDLNYKSPQVLLRMIDVLLTYVRRGADLLRLDAVTYLWYELGTRSAHLAQTHAIIQLIRAVLDVVAPRVALVSETNVPHEENISYFGDGTNEAQMVYNFALPPLTLHTFQTGDCSKLARWAATLERISDRATYFNFLDSHDGIGLLGAQGILSEEETAAMIGRVEEHGGLVSYRTGSDGQRSPYELNITWWSAINRDGAQEPKKLRSMRYVASRSIALALRGVPGLYLIGMVGGENDVDAVLRTGEARSINRNVIDAAALEAKLADDTDRTYRMLARLNPLMNVRTRCAAFHPNGDQHVLPTAPHVFGLLRRDPAREVAVVALTNVTASRQQLDLHRDALHGVWSDVWTDLLTGRQLKADDDRLTWSLPPYEVIWAIAGGGARA